MKHPMQLAIARLGDPNTLMPMQVRSDMNLLVKALYQHAAEIGRLREELDGVQVTLKALAKSASFEVSHALVESLHPKDSLQVTDMHGDHGTYKRFTFVPAPEEPRERLRIV